MSPRPAPRRTLVLGLLVLAGMSLAPPLRASTATDTALRHLAAEREALGLTEADLADVAVTDEVASGHTGVTHVYLRQRFQGIEVFGANANVNVAGDGSFLSSAAAFVPNLAAAVNRT
ncbi:MAG: hypothetical protein ACRD2T_16480, partial [Thermoanaerobaculia bacterium]